MSLTADAQGVLRGQFTIPQGVPVGTKRVRFLGSGGTLGEATYTGSHSVTIEQRRQVNTLILQRFDPLAQTFVLNEGRFLAAVSLFFKQVGQLPVRVQIRTTQTGLPTGTVLAEGQVDAADLTQNQWNQIAFDNPVYLEPNQEYALVILTDDNNHALAIAELGKYDPSKGWITAQPYQVGVLLSSSNASTWTPHQNMDLAFQLLAARFNTPETMLDLGTIETQDLTDLLALASVDRTGPQTDVTFILSNEEGTVLQIKEAQPVNLPDSYTGQWHIQAKIEGDATRAAAIYPGIQALLGKLNTTADYISRAVPCGNNATVTVSFEVHLPGQSKVEVYLERNGQWVALSLSDAQQVADDFELRQYRVQAFSSEFTRVKLVLKGTPADRPRLKNLRMIVTD